jgi:dTMP kinase
MLQVVHQSIRQERPGLFIDFEGIDGTGKGTLLRLLIGRMKDAKLSYIESKSPGWDEIRHVLFEGKVTTKCMVTNVADCLFLADHLQQVGTVIEPALKEGKIVVSDRYIYSQFAYSTERPVHPMINETFRQLTTVEPDLIFLLVGTPEHLLRRANARSSESHQSGKQWNAAEVQARIQREYLKQLVPRPETVVVPTDVLSPDELIEHYLWPEVERLLKQRRLTAVEMLN